MKNTNNKNSELVALEKKWKRIKILLDEDEDGYLNPDFFLSYPNESKTNKADRAPLFQAGFINPLNMLLRSKSDTIYKKEPQRNELSPAQQQFVKAVDGSGQSLTDIMHNEVSQSLFAYGTVFAVIDKPSVNVESSADELALAAPYMTILDPFQPIDWNWAADGSLNWIKYCIANPIDKSDPMNFKQKYPKEDDVLTVVWSKLSYSVWGRNTRKPLEEVPNLSGIVPVIIQAQYTQPNKTLGKSTAFETARYIIMANNLNSASSMEVFKNAAAILLMDVNDYVESGMGEHVKDPNTKLKILEKQAHDLKNILLYLEKKPEYLSRDLDLIEKAKECAQTYFDLAIENEKSVLSVQDAQTPASGVSKAYSFLDVTNTLSSCASYLESFEDQCMEIVAQLFAEEDKSSIKYDRDFDIRTYNQKIAFIEGLQKVSYPSDTGMKESFKALTKDITPVEKTQSEINKEIDADVPVEPVTNPTQNSNQQPDQNINNNEANAPDGGAAY